MLTLTCAAALAVSTAVLAPCLDLQSAHRMATLARPVAICPPVAPCAALAGYFWLSSKYRCEPCAAGSYTGEAGRAGLPAASRNARPSGQAVGCTLPGWGLVVLKQAPPVPAPCADSDGASACKLCPAGRRRTCCTGSTSESDCKTDAEFSQ